MIIQRIINGECCNIEISQDEIAKIMRQDKIQFAKDVLANYDYRIVGYKKHIKNEEMLVRFYDLLEEKMMENNGELELEVIEELFVLKDSD